MEKRKHDNLLLIAAVIILLIGALVQVYLIVTAKQEPAAETSSETLSQPQ
jgi:flagellar basal body-associated protein FliL